MTSFFYSLDFNVAIRVLDMVLVEGWKPMIRAGIALIRRSMNGQIFKMNK